MIDLDRLFARFVSELLRHDRPDTTCLVDGMLKQIGEVLAADHLSFQAHTEDGSPLGGPRTWSKAGSNSGGLSLIEDRSPVIGRHPGGTLRLWPSAGIEGLAGSFERLEALAGLVALAGRLAPVSSSADDEDGEIEFEDIIGDSPALRVALRRVLEVAPTDASVVIIGETGTGKELIARAVHNRSRRRGRPFVRVNCAALPPTLIESELFGHERGAFTGAVSARRGRFELAHTGTLFLDEIGDLPAEVQAKLLRVLQEGEFERVGSSESRTVDVRIVAATHHDLDAAVKEGRFRSDLFYRLNVFPIVLPPLRERKEDIPRLVWFFINQHQRALNRKFTSVPPRVLAALQQHSWPGNVRELENVIERAMIHSSGNTLLLDDGPEVPAWRSGPVDESLSSIERAHIEMVLRRCHWRINGPRNAADVLGLHPNTLRFRMKKLGLERPKKPATVIEVGRLSA